MHDCSFCQIAKFEKESFIVFADDLFIAFLDSRPLFPGHCLLIPKQHIDTFLDLPNDLIKPLFENTQLIAKSIEQAMQAEGSFIAINNRVSQSIPHLHVHIVPRRRKDGLKGFFWPRNKYRDTEHMKEVQAQIIKYIKKYRNKHHT